MAVRRAGLALVAAGLFLALFTPAQAVDPVLPPRRPAAAPVAPAAPAPPSPPKPEGTLPNGATSLQETYGDWQVACLVLGGDKRCGATQEQTNSQTRQRILALEVVPAGDRIEGVLVMPFGLVLDRGVTLQIDDLSPGSPLKFRTCVAGGCLVPVTFDSRQTLALRGGAALKAKVVVDGGGEIGFSISLKGLASALDRVVALR